MQVGVIGSGSIGPDLAYGFLTAVARRGGRVILSDIRQAALDAGAARIDGYLAKARARGKLSPADADLARTRLEATLDLSRLAECDYVLEAATEDLATKRSILEKLERIVRPDCLIGFATSGLPRSRIAERARFPDRCFVNHPFYPAWRALPVEVVLSGDHAHGQRMLSTLRELGKVPIVTADVPCFAADDIFVNYCAEAARIVSEGLATPAEVDFVVDGAIGGGGPFWVMDLTRGNLLNVHCLELMQTASTGGPWFTPPPVFRQQGNEPWHPGGKPSRKPCDEAVARQIRDRVLAVLLARTLFVADRGICDPSDLNWLTRNALGFREGLVDLASRLGADRVHELVTTYGALHPGFEVPESVVARRLPRFLRNVVVERVDGLAIVRVRRPEVRNALSEQTMLEIGQVVDQLVADPAVPGIVLSSFDGSLAGADIGELSALPDEAACEASCLRGHAVLDRIERAGKPIVAAIDGPVLGGGAELCMACHARVVGLDLVLGQPEVNLGIIPGYGGTQRLPRLVGAGRASRMLRTGLPIGASEAFAWGWASVEPAADPVRTALTLVRRHLAGEVRLSPIDPSPLPGPVRLPEVDLGHHSLITDEILVDVLVKGWALPLVEGLKLEGKGFARCKRTVDMDLGMRNFVQNGPRVVAVFLHE